MSELTEPVEVVLLPCVSTSTEKLVRCVVLHSTLLPTLIVDTFSSDQEFLYNYIYPLIIIILQNVLTCLAAKKHILLDL